MELWHLGLMWMQKVSSGRGRKGSGPGWGQEAEEPSPQALQGLRAYTALVGLDIWWHDAWYMTITTRSCLGLEEAQTLMPSKTKMQGKGLSMKRHRESCLFIIKDGRSHYGTCDSLENILWFPCFWSSHFLSLTSFFDCLWLYLTFPTSFQQAATAITTSNL